MSKKKPEKRNKDGLLVDEKGCPIIYEKKCPKKHEQCLNPGEDLPLCPALPSAFKEAVRPRPPMCPEAEDPCHLPPLVLPPPFNTKRCPVAEKEVGPCARAKPKVETPPDDDEEDSSWW